MNATQLIKLAWAKFKPAADAAAAMMPFQPAKTLAKYEPGDYRKQNAAVLEQTEFYLVMESLWTQEASEAVNPERKMQCLDLAKSYRRVFDLQKDFYSRWHLPEE